MLPLVVDDWRQPLPVAEQLPIGHGIGARESRQLSTGSIQITPHRQTAAVAEWHRENRVRIEITQAVLVERQLVVAHQGIALDEVVCGGARIMEEAGQGEFLTGGVAADTTLALEHQYLEASPCCVGGRQQAVVAGAGDDDVPFPSTAHRNPRPRTSSGPASLSPAAWPR